MKKIWVSLLVSGLVFGSAATLSSCGEKPAEVEEMAPEVTEEVVEMVEEPAAEVVDTLEVPAEAEMPEAEMPEAK